MPKVLLAEDDANLREIFEMRLKAEGFDVVTAGDGEEALVVAAREKPDLVVVDIMMPKISGFEMLENLRAHPETAGIRAIMMTALGQAEDRERGEKLGVLKYLVKSQVTLEDFVRTVRDVLNSNQTNNQRSNQMDPSNTPPATPPADDQTNASAPSSDAGMPATPPADNTASDPASLPASEPTTEQEQSDVNNQINDFASQPAPAVGDMNTPATPVPPTDNSVPSAADAGMTPTAPDMTSPEAAPVEQPSSDAGMPATPPAPTEAPASSESQTPAEGSTPPADQAPQQ